MTFVATTYESYSREIYDSNRRVRGYNGCAFKVHCHDKSSEHQCCADTVTIELSRPLKLVLTFARLRSLTLKFVLTTVTTYAVINFFVPSRETLVNSEPMTVR